MNWIRIAVERVQGWSRAQQLLAGLVSLSAILVLSGQMIAPRAMRQADTRGTETQNLQIDESLDAPRGDRFTDNEDARGPVSKLAPQPEELKEMARVPSAPQLYVVPNAAANPLIAHAAEIAVATKEFAKSRGTLEEILDRHRGYAAKLRMVGQKSGSVLSATLRVPSTELGGTVSDLKTLGDVEREEQSADEVTQQHADIEARLLNAQNTLRRLQELLKKQTYPDGNVRELQRQIANASAEVNRLEADRQSSEHRVVFANVKFTLREEIATPAETFGAQVRHAAGEGFGDAAASLTTLLVFVIGRGPALLLWGLIFYFPVRLLWKKWQPRDVQTATEQAAA